MSTNFDITNNQEFKGLTGESRWSLAVLFIKLMNRGSVQKRGKVPL
jgi:hypothetical protein